MTTENDIVDVFIVGAGPTGLFAAINLIRYGLTVQIIDISEEERYGHAADIHCRTLEILDQTGLIDQFLTQGKKNETSTVFKNGVDLGVDMKPDYSDSFHKYAIHLRQFYIEKIMIDELKRNGVKVQRPVTITALDVLEDTESHPVHATIHDIGTDTSTVVRAKYLLGCDGGQSWVRNRLSITMIGDTTRSIWARVDADITTNFPAAKGFSSIQSDTLGTLLYIPLDRGATRFAFRVFTKNNETLSRCDIQLDELTNHIKQAMAPFDIEFKKIHWSTVYQVGQRVAEQFSAEGRVFLCGDASHHLYSSGTGQGLNLGLLDVHNLAWKILWKERGAKASILDTYESERKTIAQRIISIDESQANLINLKASRPSSSGITGKFDKELLYNIKRYEYVIIGLGNIYPPTILTMGDDPCPQRIQPGGRAPDHILSNPLTGLKVRLHRVTLHTGQFHLLVFAGDLGLTIDALRCFDEYFESERCFVNIFDVDRLESFVNVIKITTTPSLLPEKGVLEDVGGKCHDRYDVDVSEGAVVVVRPDGCVGCVMPLRERNGFEEYFEGFLEKKGTTFGR